MMGMGRFRVSREAIDDGFGLIAFAGMIPIRVEMHYNGYLEVTAMSEEFPPVPHGTEPPWYEMRFIGEEGPDGRLGNWKREIMPLSTEQPVAEVIHTAYWPHETNDSLDFLLKVFPNPMRDDGVFVAEDKEIAPYPGISRMDGKPCYPTVPKTRYMLGYQLERGFAEELVKRWNALAPSLEEKRGFG